MQRWGFKYDQRCQGINPHTHCVRLDVDFRIAPDEARAARTTGSMAVYKAPAPRSWNFLDYKSDKMMAFVKLHGAQLTRVFAPESGQRCDLYHRPAAGRCNWLEYAQAALSALAIAVPLQPVRAAAFPARAQRPANSVLDASHLVAHFGWTPPQWQDDLPGFPGT